MTEATRKKHVLVTGAAGHIGAALRQYLAERPLIRNRYQLRLGVHHLQKLGDPGGHEVCQLELADLASCRQACQDIDVVIHLAANIHPAATFDELLEPNLVGAYNILRAAADQGCQRVVFASSVQAVDGYPLDVQVHTDSPVWPASIYGATKCFAEALARYFASAEGLSCIAVRIGTFELPWINGHLNAHILSKFVSQRDMSDLLVRCVEAPDVPFAIVHGASNNRFKRLDLDSTRRILGYEPVDDAFVKFGVELPGTEA